MRFSIRDLLLVTVIVAVCVAWWLDHRRQASEIKKLKEQSFNVDFMWADLSKPSASAPAVSP